MRARDRLLTALNHKEPDRVPIDLGAGLACSINVHAYDQLKRHLGLETPTFVASRFSQTADVEEVVLRQFGVDALPLRAGVIGTGEGSTWGEAWGA